MNRPKRRNPYAKARSLPVGDLGMRLPVRRELPKLQHMQLDFGEAELCYMLPLWVDGGHFVNLGDGGSATLFGLSLKHHKLEGCVTTVDCYDRREMRALQSERDHFDVSRKIKLLHMTTREARRVLGHKRCTVLLIDADHSYKGCREDVELYSNMVDKYMAFHDTNQDDVDRVIRDIVLPTWEMVFWVNRIKVFRKR